MASVTSATKLFAPLVQGKRSWLVTGSAGFIGSHLLEALLNVGQQVTSVDNFSTGHRANLEDVRRAVGETAWKLHQFIEGDIADLQTCRDACEGIDVVLHQAAIGSVPRSLKDPLYTHEANATGFLNLIEAARCARVSRFVYATSSSVYGDSAVLPKKESELGRLLSPYAVSKFVNELYADVFARCYGIETIGLRYFNVFGPRQDPSGPYAAVIPRWAARMLAGEPCAIHGDGETSRDFCFVANAVQANLRAAGVNNGEALNQVYNVAVGERMSLNELHAALASVLTRLKPDLDIQPAVKSAFRQGDIRHSLADIGKATRLLGYMPTHDARAGLSEVAMWYFSREREVAR